MASFNPLAMILNKKPLDGNNFEDWKTNLYIALDYEKIKFVLDTPKPAIPEAGANDITKQNMRLGRMQTLHFDVIFLPVLWVI